MSETPANSRSRRFDTDSLEVMRYVAKRKYKILFICSGIGIISSILIKLFVLGYSSTGSFFVNDMNVLSSNNVDLKIMDNLTPSDNFNRIFQQSISTTVQAHLINKFNLTIHYDIDSTKEFYLQQTGNKLKQNISVMKNTYNTILITVNDKDRYLAADMANEIMSYLDELNRQYYAENIERKLKISESFLLEVKKGNDAKSKSIDSLISEMHHLTKLENRASISAIYMLEMEQKLANMINELASSTRDLTNSQKLYNLALQALNQKNYKTITIVQSAMPAPNSNIYLSILYGFLISVTLLCLIILIINIKQYYSEHLNLFFKKDRN